MVSHVVGPDVGIEDGEGRLLLSLRVCSLSWRVRASWRAKGRLHVLHTNGLDPVS